MSVVLSFDSCERRIKEADRYIREAEELKADATAPRLKDNLSRLIGVMGAFRESFEIIVCEGGNPLGGSVQRAALKYHEAIRRLANIANDSGIVLQGLNGRAIDTLHREPERLAYGLVEVGKRLYHDTAVDGAEGLYRD